MATVTLEELREMNHRRVELLFVFKGGECVEIRNHIGASDGAEYVACETDLPVVLDEFRAGDGLAYGL